MKRLVIPLAASIQTRPTSPEPGSVGAVPATTLAGAKIGQWLQVEGVVGDDPLAQRLRVSGLWAGTLVEFVAKASFGGPLLFKLHGFRLALRRSEAERVLANVVESPK